LGCCQTAAYNVATTAHVVFSAGEPVSAFFATLDLSLGDVSSGQRKRCRAVAASYIFTPVTTKTSWRLKEIKEVVIYFLWEISLH
jgi:hypothetical protein